MASSNPSSSSGPNKDMDSIFSKFDPTDLMKYFANKAKIETTEGLIPPPQVRNIDAESAVPKLQKGLIEDASRSVEQKKDISSLDAKTGATPSAASDMLGPYADMNILYLSRKIPSTYIPCSSMMFYIVHLINDNLTDSRNFRRSCPDYHPYIFRLYCGIIFWVQCLRARAHAIGLSADAYQFLSRFLEANPLESLPVPAPLILLFKSICASQPELREYGFVSPSIPESFGPNRRDAFIRDEIEHFLLPNIPGIFALLMDLNTKLNPTAANAQPIYPSKYGHIPVGADAYTFGFHNFAAEAERTTKDKWSLISAGLEYPCEADRKMHEVFAERYATFGFPPMAGNDDIRRPAHFLGMANRIDWFGRVKEVASAISAAFKGSGTLADCAVSGISTNQFLIEYTDTEAVLPPPTQIADANARFPFSFKVRTSARSPQQLTVAHACLAQTNVLMPSNHPYFSTFGTEESTRSGEFWSIQPIESSTINDSGYVALRSTIKGLLDLKN